MKIPFYSNFCSRHFLRVDFFEEYACVGSLEYHNFSWKINYRCKK